MTGVNIRIYNLHLQDWIRYLTSKNLSLRLGIETDLDICDQVDDVDVVVGGHTNTFLYTGELPVGPIIEEPVILSFKLKYSSYFMIHTPSS